MSGHVAEIFQKHAAARPESIAVRGLNRQPLTYAGLLTQILSVVDTLNASGIGRNDRVAIVLPNGPEMATAFLSVASCATSAPLNPDYRAEEFNRYLEDLGAAAVIIDAGSRTIAREVARRRNIPVIELHPSADIAGRFRLSAEPQSAPKHGGFAQPDDAAIVLHTSGTTARPKIVPLRHSNICRSASQIAASLGLTDSDRCLNVMPLFHIHGLIGALLSSLDAGGSVFCSQGFAPKSALEWLQRSEATWYTAVPTMHHLILQEAHARGGVPGSHLRFIRSCSSPLAPSLMADLEATFSVPVVEAFGMTEASHQISVNPLPPHARKPGSVGRAAGTHVAVLDGAGTVLPWGSTGEIAIRGESVMTGYASNPDANATAFVDGWFRTGDQGFIDADEYIFITGRLKELINRGGEKIAPREVDEILLLHPSVAQCVTFGAPHPILGEDVAAAVVLRSGSHATEAELQEFAGRHISEFKVPRRIVMLAELPQGPTGKLQRVGVAERLGITFCASAHEATWSEPEGAEETAIAATMASILGLSRVSATGSFFDLGGTSLHAAELVSALRKTEGWNVRLAHLYRHPTARELAQVVPTLDSADCAERQHPDQELLRFNQNGSRPALFFLHSSAESSACIAELAAHCGPDQPLFVLPAHGAQGEPIPPTIEEMAAASVRAIRMLRPEGPYIVAGFCRSGAVALETARQLDLEGDTVKMLVIIDAAIDNTHVAMRWLRRFVGLEGALRGWRADRRHRRFVALRRVAEHVDGWLSGGGTDTARPNWMDPIGEAYRQARTGYVPRRYSRPVLLLKPTGDGFDRRWLKVAPGLTLGELPGGHNTCLTEHLPTVCTQLARALSDRPADASWPVAARPAYTNVN